MSIAFWIAAAFSQAHVADSASTTSDSVRTIGDPRAELAELQGRLKAAGMSADGVDVLRQAHERQGQTEEEAALFAKARAAEARWRLERGRAQPDGRAVVAAVKEVRLTYRLLLDTAAARSEAIIAALAPSDLRLYLDTVGRSEESLLLGAR